MVEGTQPEDLEDALVTWIGQVNVKNGTATDGVIKEEPKVTSAADDSDILPKDY
jgi:hypothetical protein